MGTSPRLVWATGAFVAAQVIHGLVPADTDAEGYVGLVGGLAILVASLTALYGLLRHRAWAPRLAGVTGAVTAPAITAYHLLPVHSPVTNPYPGEGVGVAPWLTVLATVGAGLWCGYEAFGRERPASSPEPVLPTG